MSNTFAIEAIQLQHHYGDHAALTNLNLSVEENQIFGLLGPNGSGKTTFIYLLSTLLSPQKGTLAVLGKSVSNHIQAIRQQLGVVFQSSQTDPILSGRENLLFHGKLYGMSGSYLTDRVDHLLQKFRLTERAHDRVKQYSGGMRRRLEIAKGLLHEPQLLVLDEPGAGLDVQGKQQLYNTLNTIRDQSERMTITIATHDMKGAEQCDRVAILNQGRVIESGPPEELKKQVQKKILDLKVKDPPSFRDHFQKQYSFPIHLSEEEIRIETNQAHTFIPELVETFPDQIQSVTLREPTLADVFLKHTGKRLKKS